MFYLIDLLPIAEAIQYEHLRAGGVIKAQEYLMLLFKL